MFNFRKTEHTLDAVQHIFAQPVHVSVRHIVRNQALRINRSTSVGMAGELHTVSGKQFFCLFRDTVKGAADQEPHFSAEHLNDNVIAQNLAMHGVHLLSVLLRRDIKQDCLQLCKHIIDLARCHAVFGEQLFRGSLLFRQCLCRNIENRPGSNIVIVIRKGIGDNDGAILNIFILPFCFVLAGFLWRFVDGRLLCYQRLRFPPAGTAGISHTGCGHVQPVPLSVHQTAAGADGF